MDHKTAWHGRYTDLNGKTADLNDNTAVFNVKQDL